MKRQSFYQDASPLINFCERHRLERDWAFPYLVEAFLPNGSLISERTDSFPCYVVRPSLPFPCPSSSLDWLLLRLMPFGKVRKRP